MDLPNKRYCFDPLSSYHLWYAEDEHDSSESDNHGTAKTDVLIQLACTSGYLTSKGCQGDVSCVYIERYRVASDWIESFGLKTVLCVFWCDEELVLWWCK